MHMLGIIAVHSRTTFFYLEKAMYSIPADMSVCSGFLYLNIIHM